MPAKKAAPPVKLVGRKVNKVDHGFANPPAPVKAAPRKRTAAAAKAAPAFSAQEKVQEPVQSTAPIASPFDVVTTTNVFDGPKVEIPQGIRNTAQMLLNTGIAVVITEGWTDGDIRAFGKLLKKVLPAGTRTYTKTGSSNGTPAIQITIPAQRNS